MTEFDTELPPVVALVNVAGIPSAATLPDLELEEWSQCFAVNATGRCS